LLLHPYLSSDLYIRLAKQREEELHNGLLSETAAKATHGNALAAMQAERDKLAEQLAALKVRL
jgi:hypothetical protein